MVIEEGIQISHHLCSFFLLPECKTWKQVNEILCSLRVVNTLFTQDVNQAGFYEHPQNIAQRPERTLYYLNMRTKCTIIPRAQVTSAIRF